MDVLEVLFRINRWWNSGKVNDVFLYKKHRREYDAIISFIEERRILSLVGPRRVGKSTLMLQTLQSLLSAGVESKRILLFSGDEPGFYSKELTVGDLIEIYIKDVLGERIDDIGSKVYIFIDEIHFFKDWQIYLKSYYDKRYNIKFIISGSSSTHLFNQSKESLLGRIDEIFILPLDFKQFYDFYKVYKKNDMPFSHFDFQMNQSLFENTNVFYHAAKTEIFRFQEHEAQINSLLREYLMVGGYPEYFDMDNIAMWPKRLNDDIIAQGIYRDIVSIHRIKNPEILERLMFFIAANQGQAFSYSTLGQTIGVDTVTVSSYIKYLTQAFLVGVQENYSTKIGKVIRKNKKLFIIDNGIRNAMLKVNKIEPSVEGQLIENCSYHNAKLFAESNGYNVFYWRDNKKEVDIVLDLKTSILPIEVKYRNTVNDSDLIGIQTFMKKYNVSHGIVVTKDRLCYKNNIYYIPFWLMSLVKY